MFYFINIHRADYGKQTLSLVYGEKIEDLKVFFQQLWFEIYILFSTNSKLTWGKFIYLLHEFINQRNELKVIKLMVGLYR